MNLTNDGWFGESAEQWQHAAAAIFRAVENGLPLVRCANNGLTCWVDANGRLRQILHDPNGKVYGAGFMTANLPLPAPEKSARQPFTTVMAIGSGGCAWESQPRFCWRDGHAAKRFDANDQFIGGLNKPSYFAAGISSGWRCFHGPGFAQGPGPPPRSGSNCRPRSRICFARWISPRRRLALTAKPV